MRPVATPPAGTGSPSIVTAISPSKARLDLKDQAQAQASPGQSSPRPWLGLTSKLPSFSSSLPLLFFPFSYLQLFYLT